MKIHFAVDDFWKRPHYSCRPSPLFTLSRRRMVSDNIFPEKRRRRHDGSRGDIVAGSFAAEKKFHNAAQVSRFCVIVSDVLRQRFAYRSDPLSTHLSLRVSLYRAPQSRVFLHASTLRSCATKTVLTHAFGQTRHFARTRSKDE